MEADARVNDLHEMAAIGNLKSVLHYCQSGVNINAQNAMNGWTALHWASHRGHEPIVRALLMRGANKTVKNNKGQTPGDLAKKPEICTLFGKEFDPSANAESDKSSFIPAYLAQPELSKLWSLPEGSTDDPKLNQEAFALLNPKLPPSTPVPRTGVANSSTSTPVSSVTNPGTTDNKHAPKEILVYTRSVADENLLGAIFANADDTIEKTIQLIKEEMDDVPEAFGLGRYNGSKVIPVNTKQYGRKTGDFFRDQDDAIIILPK
ncbi:hypothetical protein FBU30_004742 [Linnemannia zychae]|nr:hypothetical protein FBU30_004742 [Linnemannia zychae]